MEAHLPVGPFVGRLDAPVDSENLLIFKGIIESRPRAQHQKLSSKLSGTQNNH